MKLRWNYGTDAVLLPGAVVEHLDKATKKDIRILLALAAEPMTRVDLDAACKALEQKQIATAVELGASLAFWRGTGLLLADEEEPSREADSAKNANTAPAEPARVVTERGMPVYSSEELSGVLERRKELAGLIDACQRVFGKIFNTGEVSTLAGMVDYLGFDGEYILLLLSHCVRMEKKSLRYAEKLAITLHDEGVTDCAVLEERLRRIEVMATASGKIRAMFGISSRSLTTKEKGMIEGWLCNMAYTEDVLKLAYEITVDSIGKASIPYANTILERWHAAGYKTLEDVQTAIADYKRQKRIGKSSFDVDDFFEAAIKRTYGEQ